MNDLAELRYFLESENEKIRRSIPDDIYTVKAMIQMVVRTMDVFYSQHYFSIIYCHDFATKYWAILMFFGELTKNKKPVNY